MLIEERNVPSLSETFGDQISIVIPTYNEAGNIGRLVKHLKKIQNDYLLEIIVADGGSSDNTVEEAREAGATVVLSPEKGRAAQMNAGAEGARGGIIYFLHSDTFPPENYDEMIVQSISCHNPWGSFRMKFDHPHWFLTFVTWFTRLSFTFFRFGDQSLFVKKELFDTIGKFDPSQIIFEDVELARRLSLSSKGKILPIPVITSARKFRDNGIYKMFLIFSYLWILYVLRVPHNKILDIYKRLIIQDKI
ncbi:MAG: TIGR04283 family arsenosugar biosynthesis glycosyltransferase [Fulvivirga sp.]